MAEPLLDLGDIGLVGEGVGGGSSAERMDAVALHLKVKFLDVGGFYGT